MCLCPNGQENDLIAHMDLVHLEMSQSCKLIQNLVKAECEKRAVFLLLRKCCYRQVREGLVTVITDLDGKM